MHEFLRLTSPTNALETILHALPDNKPVLENVKTYLALGRTLAEDVYSPHPLPEFPRSSVDGYAVIARDTFGSSEAQPIYLNLIGEVLMGMTPSFSLTPGSCALIHTGGALPLGTDAVIMLEYTQLIKNSSEGSGTVGSKGLSEIEISHSVAEGENVLHIGEDVVSGQLVIVKGTYVRPVEIGGCMALGITDLNVAKKPRIGIISSGDEVISPQQRPLSGQVRDINTYSLAALISQAGGEPILYGIVPDNLNILRNTSSRALAECDMVVITAGSSASEHDMTAEVITSLGEPGILVHGVNVRPGKPTILAMCEGKAVFGLPGNPVSALVIASLFVTPTIEKLLGAKIKVKPSVLSRLTVNIPSQAGREDWVAVRLSEKNASNNGEIHYMAEPVFGKSNLIFSLATADGLLRIPPDSTGVDAGELVEVYIL